MSSKYPDNSLENNEPVPSTSRISNDVEVKKKRQDLITKMFPSSSLKQNTQTNNPPSSSTSPESNPTQNEITICSVKLFLPVKPYKCQMAVITKVITAIKQSKNCLVESPTGTGKTLALLCASLAWQQQEKKRIAKEQEENASLRIPALKQLLDSTAANITSPQKKNINDSEIQFVKPIHGERSIYDVSIEECNFSYAEKPIKMPDASNGSDGLVGITKNVRASEASRNFHRDLHEAEKLQYQNTDKDVTLDDVNNQKLLNNLNEQVSMIVDSNLPVIYYGARTHKQLEQVVQEFQRTVYAKVAPMTILSSRELSCIKEFDKKRWTTKNDMCRSCTKSTTPGTDSESNCLYYTNHKSLTHRSLPPAFDIKKLISVGKRLNACPYYAARRMGDVAQIVFCPYNYLIEPSIRNSIRINLNKNIVIIDEGHNIEDICRSAASFTFKKIEIEDALKELNTALNFRFANKDGFDYITYLHMVLKEWSSWFSNQKPLIDQQPVNQGEAEYAWEVKNFVQTLDNHNIGQKNYSDFSKNAKIFCKKIRDDPRLFVGITQATGTLIENLDTVFGYLFRNSGQYLEDYKPVMTRNLRSPFTGRTKSHFDMAAKAEGVSLSLECLNPGVVFAELLEARCVLLASGTLTPMISLHSELGTTFDYSVSPRHVLLDDRVWVGSLGGRELRCDSEGTRSPAVQDALGRVVQRVCEVTPHGVLCFLPSYHLMNTLYNRWRYTKLWDELNCIKDVFREGHGMEHEIIMDKYYKSVHKSRGALLFAVYRGKVAEGMDFKDHQARAVVAIGVPYPSQHTAVREKMRYNDKYQRERKLLSGREWFKVQAYRALNQAAGRVVRHARDWGAVVLVDSRYSHPEYRTHLSTWVKERLGDNHNDCETFWTEENSLKEFMIRMKREG